MRLDRGARKQNSLEKDGKHNKQILWQGEETLTCLVYNSQGDVGIEISFCRNTLANERALLEVLSTKDHDVDDV